MDTKMDTNKMEIKPTEFHYNEVFSLNKINDMVAYLNKEQKIFGRLIEIDAYENAGMYRSIILTRAIYTKEKKATKIKSICHKSIPCDIHMNDCEYGIMF